MTSVRIFATLFNPAVIGLAALFLSVLWMLRDEKDRTRPFLVVALVVNLFYGWLLTSVMGRENGLVPWKYDYVLANLDRSLGVPTAGIAQALQQVRSPLMVVYQLMVPMMIVWFLVARRNRISESLVIAYVAEMIAGPMLYAIVPGCGPLYTFHALWLHPPAVQAVAIRLSGMPNAFPSLHMATAVVFASFARGWRSQTFSILFCMATLLATISTGEHYAIDLVAGVAFGCFAASVGRLRVFRSAGLLALVLSWSLTVRFAYQFLIANPIVLEAFAAGTVIVAAAQIVAEWGSDPELSASQANSPVAASAQSI
jgi:hypothetical protein